MGELKTAAARLDAASAQGAALDAEVLARGRHDLVAPITAMVGWARLFSEAHCATARIRASEAIERNATQLVHLLAEPLSPGSDVIPAAGLLRVLVTRDKPYCRDCLSQEAAVT